MIEVPSEFLNTLFMLLIVFASVRPAEAGSDLNSRNPVPRGPWLLTPATLPRTGTLSF
jgi:hypothetical protein